MFRGHVVDAVAPTRRTITQLCSCKCLSKDPQGSSVCIQRIWLNLVTLESLKKKGRMMQDVPCATDWWATRTGSGSHCFSYRYLVSKLDQQLEVSPAHVHSSQSLFVYFLFFPRAPSLTHLDQVISWRWHKATRVSLHPCQSLQTTWVRRFQEGKKEDPTWKF